MCANSLRFISKCQLLNNLIPIHMTTPYNNAKPTLRGLVPILNPTARATLAAILLVLWGPITTPVFGQTTYTFSSTNGADIGLAASWTPTGQPSGASQDTAQWDGLTPGNLVLL